MKTTIFAAFLMMGLHAKAQNTAAPVDSSLKISNPTIIRGFDISKMSPNEQGLVMYMETLSHEEALELLKLFVIGEIVYKKEE
jgi:hypothetical protein